MRAIVLTLICLICINQTLSAQCDEWKLPEDPALRAKVDERRVLYEDHLRNNKFQNAIVSHQWLLNNVPDLQVGLYINGEKIYRNLADKASGDLKMHYADSLMIIFDLRMEYCPDPKVLDRKTLYAFKYYYKEKDRSDWLLDLFEQNLEQNGAAVMTSNIRNHMLAMKLNKLYGGSITDAAIVSKYDELGAVLNQKGKPGSADEIESTKKELDDILFEVVDASYFDCDKIKSLLAPQFREDPQNPELAKKIFNFMLKGKCTDDPLWMESGKVVLKSNPDFGLAKNIALKLKANEDFRGAESYFEQASSLAKNAESKAEMVVQLGHLDRHNGRKEDARKHYLDALAIYPGSKEPYLFIGHMYMDSGPECDKKLSKVEDRSIFWAAYKMFKAAGDKDLMQAAKSQFPSNEDIFYQVLKKGDSYKVGCWINEVVVIDARD